VSESELEAVFDHMYARRRRDIDAVAGGLHPDVVHQGVEPELVCTGRKEVLALVRRSFTRDASGVESIEMVDAGGRVVVGLTGSRFRENPVLTGALFMVFTVRAGKITRIDDYRTRDEALRAAAAPSSA
jgi:hypothetical protein